MVSTSMLGARSKFESRLIDFGHCNQANLGMSGRRYQQLELDHNFDRGVYGAMEFR